MASCRIGQKTSALSGVKYDFLRKKTEDLRPVKVTIWPPTKEDRRPRSSGRFDRGPKSSVGPTIRSPSCRRRQTTSALSGLQYGLLQKKAEDLRSVRPAIWSLVKVDRRPRSSGRFDRGRESSVGHTIWFPFKEDRRSPLCQARKMVAYTKGQKTAVDRTF